MVSQPAQRHQHALLGCAGARLRLLMSINKQTHAQAGQVQRLPITGGRPQHSAAMGLQVGQGRERRQRLPLAQARGDHLQGRMQRSDRRDHLLRADRAAPTELLADQHRHLDFDLQGPLPTKSQRAGECRMRWAGRRALKVSQLGLLRLRSPWPAATRPAVPGSGPAARHKWHRWPGPAPAGTGQVLGSPTA